MKVICTVTNDLTYDQRMHRICSALVAHGYEVTLIGRKLPNSIPLEDKPYRQIRFTFPFRSGFAFYAVYNIRIFWYLLVAPYDAVCSIDLDSLPAGCMATLIRRKKRVFDAHEYFTEVPEVVNRPFVKRFWALVARFFLPFYQHAYTVGPGLAALFKKIYGLDFAVVRNVPNYSLVEPTVSYSDPKILLYQGALNEGRGIETLLQAMQLLPGFKLLLAGEGDLSHQLRQMSKELGLEDRVTFLGFVKPDDLKSWTRQAWLSLNLLENRGLSYYYSLANKFFDSVQAGIPVLTMDFPEYHALNKEFEVAVLLADLNAEKVADAINALSTKPERYQYLQENCYKAARVWNWEHDQKVLLEVWNRVGA